VRVETRVEWEVDNCKNFLLCLSKPIRPLPNPDWLDRQRRKFLQLSTSHSTRVSIPTTSISGPGLHVDGLTTLVAGSTGALPLKATYRLIRSQFDFGASRDPSLRHHAYAIHSEARQSRAEDYIADKGQFKGKIRGKESRGKKGMYMCESFIYFILFYIYFIWKEISHMMWLGWLQNEIKSNL